MEQLPKCYLEASILTMELSRHTTPCFETPPILYHNRDGRERGLPPPPHCLHRGDPGPAEIDYREAHLVLTKMAIQMDKCRAGPNSRKEGARGLLLYSFAVDRG